MALPDPETVRPRLAAYGQTVADAYDLLYQERDPAAFQALGDAILRAVGELPAEESGLRPEWRLQQDLSLDSIGLAEAAFIVEDIFGVRLDNATLERIGTVGDLRAVLSREVWEASSGISSPSASSN